MSATSLQRTREQWLATIRRTGIRPERSMGQNFLVEPKVVAEMADAAAVDDTTLVVEVGPGHGILTRELLDRGAEVVAVELDRDLMAFLQADIGAHPRLSLVERDARHVDMEDHVGNRPYHLVANLPYSTGTVILRHFLALPRPPETITVMVQREVAERMVATVPNMSLLTLAIQLRATSDLALIVPPDVFVPPPKVESAVAHLVTRTVPLVGGALETTLFKLATMAFQRKRKTLANGLSQGLGIGKSDAEALVVSVGIDPMARPQTVTLEQWIALARATA